MPNLFAWFGGGTARGMLELLGPIMDLGGTPPHQPVVCLGRNRLAALPPSARFLSHALNKVWPTL